MIKKLIMDNTDKVKHFVISYTIMLTLILFIDVDKALAITMFIGLAKEVYDQKSYGGFSWPDLLADFIGAIAAMVIVQL